MELIELKQRIIDSFSGTDDQLQRILSLVDQDEAFFPFNQYEYLILNLVQAGGFSFDQYRDLREEYLVTNRNLWLFEMSAPRGFGTFAESHIQAMGRQIQYPSKKLDPTYNGEYDLWLDGIKIEVKASRMVDAKSDAPLYLKALSSKTKSDFWMNFQQLKPKCCEVFVWMAVYRDLITIWVLNSKEVVSHPDYSGGQHRGNQDEGQLHIKQHNIASLDKYKYDAGTLTLDDAIRYAARRGRDE